MDKPLPPTKAYRIAAIASLVVGLIAFITGLFNAEMQLNEKGYYLAVLILGLFSAVSLQKTVRDKAEDIPTSQVYYTLCWISTGLAVSLLVIGLYNANLLLSEKGFYGMTFLLTLFASVSVQKNVRDMMAVAQNANISASHSTDEDREDAFIVNES